MLQSNPWMYSFGEKKTQTFKTVFEHVERSMSGKNKMKRLFRLQNKFFLVKIILFYHINCIIFTLFVFEKLNILKISRFIFPV